MPNHTYRTRAPRSLPVRTLAFAVALAAASLLTACGEQPTGQEVASVSGQGTQSSGPQPTATAASGRPQIRVDSSDDETRELWQGWFRCLKEHGAPIVSKGLVDGKEFLTHAGNDSLKDPAYLAAEKACEVKEPLLPPEEDPSTNPNYDDDVREWVQCMRGRGLKVSQAPKGSAGTFNFEDESQKLDPTSDKIMFECKVEAFSAKK